MKRLHQHIRTYLLMFCILFSANELLAQSPATKNRILIDVAHGQKFWNDPATMKGDPNFIERVKYMTAELKSTASSVNADLGYLKGKIKPADLATCNLLFIHLPSSKYDADEVDAIKQYVQKGGALFLVMDEDYWTTLDLTNVNDILSLSNIKFGSNSPDTLSGGYTKPSALTAKKLKVTYHGGRIVMGGTPFCYDNQSEKYPFGSFTKLKSGGKIVAMGDGMASLYMTSWKDVNDYQCREFMHEVFAWLVN